MAFQPRLILRIIWNSDFTEGDELASRIYSRMCREVERPASRGLGIPVYFHKGRTPAEAGLPAVLQFDAAGSTVVIPLLDSSIRANEVWQNSIREIESTVAGLGRRNLFLPIACEDRVMSVVDTANCIRLFKESPSDRPVRLISTITHELARLLLAKSSDVHTESFGTLEKSNAPVKLFLSHSKHGADGTIIAEELRDYGRRRLPVATFYDSNDIAPGHNFESEIMANVAESAMIVVHTDTYSDRSWCRREILAAKRFGCPVLLVDAVTVGEDRAFPYIGNAPSVRWLYDSPKRCEIVIDAVVREVLKNAYFLEHVKAIKKAGYLTETSVEIPNAPEVLTYLNLVRAKKCDRAKPSVLLYPDPPLGDEEIEVLESLSNVTVTTPTAVAVAPGYSTAAPPFKDRLIGLSISDSPDLAQSGMGIVHLQDAMVECARHLLMQGASLAYGGDLRPGGFTTILFDLVRSHNRAGTRERIRNFLAWPIWVHLNPKIRNEYMDELREFRVSPPVDLNIDRSVFISPDAMPGRYIWSRSLTAMRAEMNDSVAARVLLGGQVRSYKGKYPGVFEEALFAVRANKPLYLIGGFGGCTQSIVETLKGGTPEPLTEAFHASEPTFGEMAALYQEDATQGKGTPIDYASEVKYLQSVGFGGIRNGLDERENQTLAQSKNLPEIIYLVLKGMSHCFKEPA